MTRSYAFTATLDLAEGQDPEGWADTIANLLEPLTGGRLVGSIRHVPVKVKRDRGACPQCGKDVAFTLGRNQVRRPYDHADRRRMDGRVCRDEPGVPTT